MIRSMTAYARREIKGEWGSATWEMRSVNQRYLETYFRLPEQFRSLEPVVRERIRTRLTRGKVECMLRFEPDASAQGELILNEKLAKQLVSAANWVKMQSDEGEINPVDILRWPGVMAAQELVMMAQRIDVAEELDRLEAHIKETYNILKKKEAVGRRLDFMMQEFNRESNTLASKSINADVTNSAIELKVLIEQMREQIQNIE
ncbi:TPA: YicC family protein [Salmonella enterica subsp. enterica serovar Dublin]|nr:YicC family protein [Salmonella enterica subsp. enterica serovar Dublin]HBK3923008.1 YicC family protein [Salmonella enterica subsp. enterica serovar Dublin]